MATGGTLDGVGAFILHGFTPALDLFGTTKSIQTAAINKDDEGTPVTDDTTPAYLICSAGDPRHLLKTLAWQHRHEEDVARDLDFYVHETHPEGVARQMLLISVALDTELSVQDAQEMFLDIYGNSRTRERTADYIATRAKELIEVVVNGEGPLADKFDLSLMKHRERDDIEQVLLRYSAASVPFDIDECRDTRMRRYYGPRYDARENLIDWDKTMKLQPLCTIIHKLHFTEWRLSGLGFMVRDCVYNMSNRTLATRLGGSVKGQAVTTLGYWGDIVNSPYYAFGIESEELSLFTKRSEQHVKGSTHVSEYNVQSYIHELRYGGRYALPKGDQIEGVTPTVEGVASEAADVLARRKWRIRFLSPSAKVSDVVVGRKKYSALFDAIYLSSTALPAVSGELTECVKRGDGRKGVAIVEKVTYILDLTDEQKQGFTEKATEIMTGAGWTLTDTSLSDSAPYLTFAC